jgi:hypothetical protein
MTMRELATSKLTLVQALGVLVLLVPVLLATGGYIKDVEDLKRNMASQNVIIEEIRRDSVKVEVHLAAIQAELKIISKQLEKYEQKSRNNRQ